MEIKKYYAPRVEVIEVKAQGVLCQSKGNTENFTLGGNYGDSDWE